MGKYGYRVIDGDGHVAEPEEMWARFLPPPYRDAAPRVITDNRGVKRVLIDGWFWTTPPGPGVGHPGGYVGGPRVDKYAGGSDPSARLADMDTEGIDVAVLFATVAMGPSSGVLPSGDVEFEAALCRAYNSWVAEYAATDRARLKPVAVLPTRHVVAAVGELTRWIGDLGFVGPELPTNSAGTRYPGDPHFHPIYEAAQSLGVPIFIHPHAGGQILCVGRERFDSFFHGHMISFPFEQMIAAMPSRHRRRLRAVSAPASRVPGVGDRLGAVLVRADGRALREARPAGARPEAAAERLGEGSAGDLLV